MVSTAFSPVIAQSFDMVLQAPADNTLAGESVKAIVFTSASYSFALPMGAVSRILHRSLLATHDLDADLVYLDEQPVEVLDLSVRLPARSGKADWELEQRAFLLLIQQDSRRVALAADSAPILLTLPLEKVQAVPSAYRDRLKGLAEGMVVMKKGDRTVTVFLLALAAIG
jgi:chemotaxis signal transduction protein